MTKRNDQIKKEQDFISGAVLIKLSLVNPEYRSAWECLGVPIAKYSKINPGFCLLPFALRLNRAS